MMWKITNSKITEWPVSGDSKCTGICTDDVGAVPSPEEPEGTTGMKFDSGKPLMDLLPPRATLLLLDATSFPEKKVLTSLYRFWESGDEKFLEHAIVELSALCNDNYQCCVNTLDGVAKVLTFGAQKYDPHNWAKGIKLSRNFAATIRHITQVALGNSLDEESGLHHYYHALCDLFFIYETLDFTDVKDWDDRFRWEDRCSSVL